MLLAVAFTWGSSFVVVKKILSIYPAGQLASLYVIFASLSYGFFALKDMKVFSRGKYRYVFAYGLTRVLLPPYFFTLAQTKITSSLTGILNTLTPIFTVLLGVMFFQLKIRRLQMIGVLVAFIGCTGLLFVNDKGTFGKFNFFVVFVLLATFCNALSANISKAKLSEFKPTAIVAVASVMVMPFALIYISFTDFFEILRTVDGAIEALVYVALLGLFVNAIGLTIYNMVLQKTNQIFTSTISYIIPVVAIFWGVLAGEKLFALHYAGLGLIFFGLYLADRHAKEMKI